MCQVIFWIVPIDLHLLAHFILPITYEIGTTVQIWDEESKAQGSEIIGPWLMANKCRAKIWS